MWRKSFTSPASWPPFFSLSCYHVFIYVSKDHIPKLRRQPFQEGSNIKMKLCIPFFITLSLHLLHQHKRKTHSVTVVKCVKDHLQMISPQNMNINTIILCQSSANWRFCYFVMNTHILAWKWVTDKPNPWGKKNWAEIFESTKHWQLNI